MKNENIEYEMLVKEIYEYLHKAEEINNINIQHNVKIKGLTGCKHQIDVYWVFEIAGVKYQVAIECKNYAGKVSIGKLRDFNSVLEDIGNINGIFVSKNGFQSGAVEYAKQKKIMLKEIRHPNENDWEDRIKDIVIDLNAYFKEVKSRDIEIDQEWLHSNSNYKVGHKITFSGMNNEIFIDDIESGEKKSIYDLENTLDAKEEGQDFIKQFMYKNAYLINSDGQRVKVKSITYTYDVKCATETIEIRGDDIAKAIIKDIVSGNRKFIDIYGNVK